MLTKIEAANLIFSEKQQDLSTAKKEYALSQKNLNDNKLKIEDAQNAVLKAEEKIEEIKNAAFQKKETLRIAAETANKNLESEKKNIEGQNIEELQNGKSLADQAMTDLKRAIEVVGALNTSKEEVTKNKKRNNELETRNEVIEHDLTTFDIENLSKEVETLRKTHTLMTSENWQKHRFSLENGKACPLCGSTEHPYKQNVTLFNEAESELEKLLKEKEQALKTQSEKKTNLINERTSNETEMMLIKKRLEELSVAIRKTEFQWDGLQQLHPEFPKLKAELETLEPVFEKKQNDADNALKTFNTTQKKIENLTDLKTKAEKAQSEYEQTSREQMDAAKETQILANTKLTEAKALTPNLLHQVEEKEKALDKAIEEHKNAEDALKDLKNLYNAELNGESPDAVENRLQKNKEDNDNAIIKKNEDINKLEGNLREKTGTISSQQSQVDIYTTAHTTKNEELNQWVKAYNEKEDRLQTIGRADVEAIANARNSWDVIRQKKQEYNNAVVSATTLLENARKTHEDHQKTKPQCTREELLEKQEELQKNSNQELLVAAKAKKKNHDDAVQRLGDTADELARVTKVKKDWVNITDAIGGDGNTLRKIAQCYTLQFLIEHANAEIRKFNSRYELMHVKNSLGIRVIDHDRADDVRDTTSLSGGETFIVSLGLALGLSSLSSRNISFENLFIDEGFGTLDPDTLATVIDSLAMLQSNQGKKVGVISHTDTMSERITTQIRIVKNGNSGSSHIEIYP